MSRSYENRRRRQGVYAFLVAYLGLLLTVIALEAVRSHQLGYGLF
ncbi:hypothetical protein MPUL_42260 [Mycolicibacterium pulveris]|uniref:Uncharacterized protein n=1 Tax=Mycolicibacterium pulveris TaxID=36813 RepID=A0A7I7UNU4_MYCPV|nr:hypothetical protein [Mycolicibacterium pulveris]BBY83068.1 hypothetical protein MPUL_42260 [Mycolicibacterium pulveris]